jgi:hypothetical protein
MNKEGVRGLYSESRPFSSSNSFLVELINRRSRWIAGRSSSTLQDIEVIDTHGGKSQIAAWNRLKSEKGEKVTWMIFLFPFRACK